METSKFYLKRSDFNSLDEMLMSMNQYIDMLMERNYACSVYRSLVNDNVYVIEYASMDPLLNDEFSMPFWLNPKEASAVATMRKQESKKNTAELEDFSDDFFPKGGSGHHEA